LELEPPLEEPPDIELPTPPAVEAAPDIELPMDAAILTMPVIEATLFADCEPSCVLKLFVTVSP
jgi:hypothetical protein